VIEAERNRRTVFISKVASKATIEDITRFFTEKGIEVVEIKIIMDKNTRKSKGLGFAELQDLESVPAAIALTGQTVCGLPISIQKFEPPAAAPDPAKALPPGVNLAHPSEKRRLYVGGIPSSVQEATLHATFGALPGLQHIDHNNRSKGFVFVQYASTQLATEALEHFQGLNLDGKTVRVMWMTVPSMIGAEPAPVPLGASPLALAAGASPAAIAAAQARAALVSKAVSDAHLAASSEVLESGGGMKLTKESRANLMQKLMARDGGGGPAQPPQQQQQQPHLPPAPAQNPMIVIQPSGSTPCIVLENMFTPENETGPDWVEELKEDVIEEAGKQGGVTSVAVDTRSPNGVVLVRMVSKEAAKAVIELMHNRWFDGKQIQAVSVTEPYFDQLFALAEGQA
jgi:RNA-binding protein 39